MSKSASLTTVISPVFTEVRMPKYGNFISIHISIETWNVYVPRTGSGHWSDSKG